tara:strand:- start:13 stop:255 length:243 start_codon:yes stop_codon:yes gene_type:complete
MLEVAVVLAEQPLVMVAQVAVVLVLQEMVLMEQQEQQTLVVVVAVQPQKIQAVEITLVELAVQVLLLHHMLPLKDGLAVL